MKRILPTDPPIPNTIDRDAKRALKKRSVVNHSDVVFDLHDESWTRDGREDAPVSARSSAASSLAHDTDNRSDGAEDAHFEGNSAKKGSALRSRSRGTRHLGQPQLCAAHDHGHE